MTLTKSLFAAAFGAALSVAAIAPAFAAGFMKIPGIEGNAKSDVYKGWVELKGFSTANKPPAAGRRIIDNEGYARLTSTIFSSSAVSTKLKAAASGKTNLAEVKLDFVNDAGVVYLSIIMTDVIVSSVKSGGSAADDRPTEEVAFYYNRIAFNYAATAAGKDGKKGGNVEFEWKVEEGES